jgi:hypothetical protein|tara:strand:- start:1280 stop:2356 length:1077 start_codon:yes stop_codon:yes gene_type:complete
MIKNIIIGAGFSAAISKIFTGNKTKIIGSLNHQNLKDQNYFRRKTVEVNKLMSKKAFSYGTLKFNLKNGKMHDRLTSGGNANIWGGNIDVKKIPKRLLGFLKKHNINFEKLSFRKTGTISNNKNIMQIQSREGLILKTEHLSIKIKNGYIINFFTKKKKLFINIKNSKKSKLQTLQVKKLFLCVGSVQLLDLLYRSNLLKENDIIEFSEFSHHFKWRFIFSVFGKNITTVRYHFCRALGHFFGIQYFARYLKLFSFVPLCVDQKFYLKKNSYKLTINNGTVTEIENQKFGKKKFGNSIHYCNMKINNIEINKYLNKINSDIIGFGMSFINQKKPGPISNEILLDIEKKLRKIKFKIKY